MENYVYPWLRKITLKQLRGFDAILNAKSITGAAKILHLTPPAVSLQLKDLEATTGIPLVEQSNTGYIPTQSGRMVQELSDKISKLLNEYGEALNDLSGLEQGHASIGVVNPARYFMPNLLVKYKDIHPNIKLRLNVGNRETIVSQLESLDLDMAFMGRPPDAFAVESKAIGNHPQVIIAPADHEFSDKLQLSFSKLNNQNFLLREVGSGTRTVADKLFKNSNCSPKTAIEFGSNETIKQAVIAGMGIAIISAHTVAAELADKRLISLDVKGLPVNRKWYIVKHKNKRLAPSSLALWDYVVQYGKNFLPKGHLT
jgi:DNA-binding transcriptional LysR family regulator